MKIAVCVKAAIDEAELKTDRGGAPLLAGAVTKTSTFDKNAVEEAVKVKAAQGGEVTVFSLGLPEAKKVMKEALAMGADRGVHVVADPSSLGALATSFYLAEALRKAGPFDLIFCSEGSSDVYTGLVPPMLAERLGLPFLGYARRVEVAGGKVKAEQALEESVDTLEAETPAVISVVSEINEPRYPTLIQIMQAAKKPMEEIQPSQLPPFDPAADARVKGMAAQAMSRKRVLFEGPPGETAQKLVEALAKEGVL
jgi:electron transfer flavoprotein beta subunit